MPSIAVTRKYEACYILKPDASDDQIKATIARYKHVVENAGGAVERTGVWERRKLAYEIKGYTDGIFVLLNFSGEAKVEHELRRIFQISTGEDQIRYMIVKPEEAESLGGRPSVEVTETLQRPSIPAPPAPVPAAVAAVEAAPVAVEEPAAEAPAPAEVEAEAPAPVEAVAEEPAPVAEVEAEAPAVEEEPVAVA
jgi:small subunit ribosomal protein S6